MKKLRLRLDDLHVDSFDTRVEGAPLRGTVPAHQATRPDVCWTAPDYCASDDAYSECGGSCFDTCAATCPGTCGDNFTCAATCAGYTCPPECFD